MEYIINSIKLSKEQKIQYYFVYGIYWNNDLTSLDLEVVSISLKIAANLFSGNIFRINLDYLKKHYSPKSTHDYVSAIKEIYHNNAKRLLIAHNEIVDDKYSKKLFLDTDFEQFEPFWKEFTETTETNTSFTMIIRIDDDVASNYRKYIGKYHSELYQKFYSVSKVAIICSDDSVLFNNVKLPINSFATYECEQYFESRDYISDNEIIEKYNEYSQYCMEEYGTEYCVILDQLIWMKTCPKTFENFSKDKTKYKYYRDCDTEITDISNDICYKIATSILTNGNKLVDNYDVFKDDCTLLLKYSLFELYNYSDLDKNLTLIQKIIDLDDIKINNQLFTFFMMTELKNFY